MALTKAHNRMIDGAFINVMDYGASNNNTEASGTTSAIQAAITAATSQGKVLYFPSGTYAFNSKLVFTCEVEGEHFPNVILKASGSALSTSDYAVHVGAETGVARRMSFNNIVVEGDNLTAAANNGLIFNSQWFSNHKKLWVRGFYGDAITIKQESYWNIFEDIMANFDGNGGPWVTPYRGIYCNGASGFGVTQSTFINTKANGRTYGMEMQHCDQLQIINFDGQNANYALGITSNNTNINVLSLYAEACTTAAVYNDSPSVMITGMSTTSTPLLFDGTIEPTYMEFTGTNSGRIILNKRDNAMGYQFDVDNSTETLKVISSRAGAAIRNMQLGSDLTLSVNGTASIVTSGAGSPEGAVTASVGSLYMRTEGGAGTSLYVKESGTGNTGWAAK